MVKYAGTLWRKTLRDAGVLSYGSEDKGKDLHNDTGTMPKNLAVQIDTLMSKLESNKVRSSSQPPVTIGTGLSALPKKLIARVLANEYINFLEVPPVKVKRKPMPQSLEGQVIVVQAAAVADKEDYSGSGLLDAVFLNLHHNSQCKVSTEVARINGLPDDYRFNSEARSDIEWWTQFCLGIP